MKTEILEKIQHLINSKKNIIAEQEYIKKSEEARIVFGGTHLFPYISQEHFFKLKEHAVNYYNDRIREIDTELKRLMKECIEEN